MSKGSKKSAKQRSFIQRFFSAATARTTGWIDGLQSMIALLIIGAIFAAIPIAIGLMTATALSYITAYQISMICLVGLALFNYFFGATLEALKLKAIPVTPDQSHAGVDLTNMVNNLCKVANEHEDQKITAQKKHGAGTKDPKKPKKFPKKVKIATFTSEHGKKIIASSRRFGSCTVFIPSGLIHGHTSITEQELAALIMVELMKKRNARARVGILNTAAKVGLYFMEFIENSFESPYLLIRCFGHLSMSFQFFLLYEKSCSRTYHYEAIKDTVEVCGEPFRAALISASTKIGKPTLDIGVTIPVRESEPKQEKINQPKSWWQRGQKALKRKSKKIYESCEEIITHIGKGVNESFSDIPSAMNAMQFLDNLAPMYTFSLRSGLSHKRLAQKNVIYIRESRVDPTNNRVTVMMLNPNPHAMPRRLRCSMPMQVLNIQSLDNLDTLDAQTRENIIKKMHAVFLNPSLQVFSTQPIHKDDHHDHDHHDHDHHHAPSKTVSNQNNVVYLKTVHSNKAEQSNGSQTPRVG